MLIRVIQGRGRGDTHTSEQRQAPPPPLQTLSLSLHPSLEAIPATRAASGLRDPPPELETTRLSASRPVVYRHSNDSCDQSASAHTEPTPPPHRLHLPAETPRVRPPTRGGGGSRRDASLCRPCVVDGRETRSNAKTRVKDQKKKEKEKKIVHVKHRPPPHPPTLCLPSHLFSPSHPPRLHRPCAFVKFYSVKPFCRV